MAERKWNEKENNGEECLICTVSHNDQLWETTCCQKATCNNCYTKMTDKCPYCNCGLTHIPEILSKNTKDFTKYINKEIELSDEQMARNLEAEEYRNFALDLLMELGIIRIINRLN